MAGRDMKLRVTLVLVPVLALVIVAAAFAGTDGGASKASSSAAAIACGTTRTIGLASPITGPAASIGVAEMWTFDGRVHVSGEGVGAVSDDSGRTWTSVRTWR